MVSRGRAPVLCIRPLYRPVEVLFYLTGLTYLAFLTYQDSHALEFWRTNVNVNTQKPTLFYYFFPASFLYFGLGSLSYHWLTLVKKFRWGRALAIVGLDATSLFLFRPHGYLPWKFALIGAISIPVVFELTKRNRIDRAIGELSNPVYILHFPIITLLTVVLSKQAGIWRPGLDLILTLSVAILVAFYVEAPIERFRERVAKRALGLRKEGLAVESPA